MNNVIASSLSRPMNAGGLICLAIALIGGALFFLPGLETLAGAWQTPEYSHGPLIPLLSGFLLLRHLKTIPERPGPIDVFSPPEGCAGMPFVGGSPPRERWTPEDLGTTGATG